MRIRNDRPGRGERREFAKAYVKSVEGDATGLIIDARKIHL
jgi:hypothetical protein